MGDQKGKSFGPFDVNHEKGEPKSKPKGGPKAHFCANARKGTKKQIAAQHSSH
jgi:hypothetical protein